MRLKLFALSLLTSLLVGGQPAQSQTFTPVPCELLGQTTLRTDVPFLRVCASFPERYLTLTTFGPLGYKDIIFGRVDGTDKFFILNGYKEGVWSGSEGKFYRIDNGLIADDLDLALIRHGIARYRSIFGYPHPSP